MKVAFYEAVKSFTAEIVILGVMYFGLAFLKILPLDISWSWLFGVLVIIFIGQFIYFYFKK